MELSIEDKLVEAVEAGLYRLWEEEEAQHIRKEGVYYPSAIGACLRKQYYIYTLERRPSPEKLAIFATGKGVHKAVADALSASGIVNVESEEVETRLTISQEIELRGRIDILLVEMDGEKVVVEVKSVSKLPENPYENHLLQLQAYLHATKLNKGALLYWDKRTGKVKAFSVTRDENYLAKVAERAIILHEYLKRKAPPPKEAVVEGRLWECDVCEYADVCNPFLLEGIPSGESLAVFSLDGTVVDDSERRKMALRLAGLPPSVDPEEIRGTLKASYLKLYFDPMSYSLDRPEPEAVKEIWEQRKKGMYIVILSERPEEHRAVVENELKSMGIPFDALVLRCEEEQANKWKLKMIKRLKTNYNISIYVDSNPNILKRIERSGVAIKLISKKEIPNKKGV